MKRTVQWTPENHKRYVRDGTERHAAPEGGSLHSGQCRDALQAQSSQLRHARRFLIWLARERHLHGEHMARLESQIHRAHGQERANQQSRSDQQHQGESHFGGDQDGMGLVLSQSGARRSTALFEWRNQVGAAGL